VVVAVLACVFAPAVDNKHPPERLDTFFNAAAAAIAMIGVALLAFRRGKKNASVLGFLTPFTVVYTVGGFVASLAGNLPLSDGVYRYLFGATAGAVLAVVTTFVLCAVASVVGQREEGIRSQTCSSPPRRCPSQPRRRPSHRPAGEAAIRTRSAFVEAPTGRGRTPRPRGRARSSRSCGTRIRLPVGGLRSTRS
jgi:hypothetical protein